MSDFERQIADWLVEIVPKCQMGEARWQVVDWLIEQISKYKHSDEKIGTTLQWMLKIYLNAKVGKGRWNICEWVHKTCTFILYFKLSNCYWKMIQWIIIRVWMGGSKSRVPFHAPVISKCWSVGGKESKLGAKVSVAISFKCFRCEGVEKSKVSFPPEMAVPLSSYLVRP